MRATREIDLLDSRVLDQRRGDCGSVFWVGLDDVQDSVWETCFLENSCDGAEGAGCEFGSFEDGCICQLRLRRLRSGSRV